MLLEGLREPVVTELEVRLDKGRVWAGRGRRDGGLRIRCIAGRLWVTWQGSGDRVLEAGEALEAGTADRVVVQALETGRMEASGFRGDEHQRPW